MKKLMVTVFLILMMFSGVAQAVIPKTQGINPSDLLILR